MTVNPSVVMPVSRPIQRLAQLLSIEQLDDETYLNGILFAQALQASTCDAGDGFIPTSIHGLFVRKLNNSTDVRHDITHLKDDNLERVRKIESRQDAVIVFMGIASYSKLFELSKQSDVSIFNDYPSFTSSVVAQLDDKEMEGSWRSCVQLLNGFNIQVKRTQLPPSKSFKPRRRLRFWLKCPEVDYNRQTSVHSILAALLSFSATALHISDRQMPVGQTIWFHESKPLLHDWILCELRSTAAGSTRMFVSGTFSNKEGHLLASISQELAVNQPSKL
ncbi:Acyl-CoA thioesterase II [Aphelenchoides besseyi]|nr:Acyl-CoA thioesterase II [Aphelenchoides besseyi]